MSSGRIAQHRNYGDIMARHERDIKLKRVTRIFIYFIIIAVLILLFLFVRRWEENTQPKAKQSTAMVQRAPERAEYKRLMTQWNAEKTSDAKSTIVYDRLSKI